MPLFDEQGATVMIAAWKEWLESQPLETLVPREKAKRFVRRISDEKTATTEVAPRVEKAFDIVLERARKIERSPAQLLGDKLAQRLIEAVGDLEPDEAAVRGFFEERAVGDLLGAVLYDGIIEFMKKANQLSELVPGMQTAKKLAGGVGGLLGGLAGGLAGSLAGGMREEIEKKLEAQVRSFLAGFGKIAVDRAIRFATSPANKKLFREMRMNLARKALERPVKDVFASLDAERAAELKKRLSDGLVQTLREERESHRLEGEVDRFADEHGKKSIAEVVKRHFGDVIPTELFAKFLAPTLAKFPPGEAARAAFKDAASRLDFDIRLP